MDLKIIRLFKTTIFVVFVAFFVLTSTGCDERDALAGALIGGGIGLALSDRDRDNNRHRRHRRHRHRRHSRRNVINPLTAPQYLTDERLVSLRSYDAHTQQVITFAQRFDINTAAADLFLVAMKRAEQGDIQGLYEIGLTQEDMNSIHKLESIDNKALRMASRLGIPIENAKLIIAEFVNEARIQFSDINSPAWQQCIANGVWKTPQNSYCSRTNLSGCGPYTGATMCIPAY